MLACSTCRRSLQGVVPGAYLKPGEGIEFLKALRQHAIDNIEPELLQDRRDILGLRA